MNRLRRWLTEQGISQEEFAARIGAHQTQLSRYVTENVKTRRCPPARLRREIEKATGGAVPASSWRPVRRPKEDTQTAA